MSSFTWTPEFGSSRETVPDVKPVKFGDGFEARNRFGLNTIRENWSLQFANRDASEANAIDSFLTARGAAEPFEWTPPGDSAPKVFVCRKWTKTPVKHNLFSISATFEQVFEPA